MDKKDTYAISGLSATELADALLAPPDDALRGGVEAEMRVHSYRLILAQAAAAEREAASAERGAAAADLAAAAAERGAAAAERQAKAAELSANAAIRYVWLTLGILVFTALTALAAAVGTFRSTDHRADPPPALHATDSRLSAPATH